MDRLDVIAIGPAAFAVDRLVALALMLVFVWGVDGLAQRRGVDRPQVAFAALVAGLVAARLGYVGLHWQSFLLEPLEIARVWLGGWFWPAGVVAAVLVLAWRLRRTRALVPGLALLAAMTLVWTGFAAWQGGAPARRIPPELSFETLRGELVSLRDAPRGETVINLWATWCPPCRREMPMLVRAAAREPAGRIRLINQGESRADIVRFLKAQGLGNAPVLLDPDATLGRLTGGQALPITVLVAADGTVRSKHVGEISAVQLDILLRSAQMQAR